MAKYTLKKCGYGKYRHFKPVQISDKKAEKLEGKGVEVFNSRDQALNKIEENR